MRTYEGLIAAPHSPFDSAGDLNLAAIERQAEVLVEGGVLAAFVCGSTGEGHSLTLDERRAIARRWVEVAKGRFDVIVHVGHNCQRDAMMLAGHAQSIGAAAVAALAPSYFRPATVEDLVGFMATLAGAARELSFYYYDIPSMTGLRLGVDQFIEKAAGRIANLAGVKFTSDDLPTLQLCLAMERGRYQILFGMDEILLAAVSLGARGAVGSTYNYAPRLYQQMMAAFARGEINAARELQRKSVEMVRVLQRFGGLRAGKAIMEMIGADCGPVRSPMTAMTLAERVGLYESLSEMDVFVRPLKRPTGA